MARPLRVGLMMPHGEGWSDGVTASWVDLLAMARLAEDAGFDSLWVVDHLLMRWAAWAEQDGFEIPPELATGAVGVWEGWSLLAALAACTSRIELGTLVTCTGYRNPALLAKMAETVDEISGGRIILGVGAGDLQDEHRTFGFQWDHRVSRFEEALAIITPLLREGRVDFTGHYYQARDCELRPRGPRSGGPPILIGALGNGPRMMRLVAQYADIWNGWLAFGQNRVEAVPPLREAVDAACVSQGRDPSTLVRTVAVGAAVLSREGSPYAPIGGEPEEIAAALTTFAAEGISHIQVDLEPATLDGITAFAEVLAILDAA